MRCFIGMPITQSTRERLAELQRDIVARAGPAGAGLRAIAPATLHLTLKFLGEITQEHCSALVAALASLKPAPFRAALRGVQALPTAARARVIVACVDEGKPIMVELMRATEEACASLGFPREQREHTPHVTIFRVRSGGRELKWTLAATTHAPLGELETGSIVLFRSHMTREGSTYETLATL